MKGVNFEDLARSSENSPVTAVAGAADISVLELVRRATGTYFILVDSRDAVRQAALPLKENPENWDNCEIVEPEGWRSDSGETGQDKIKTNHLQLGEAREAQLCRTASELCSGTEAGVLMKGRVHTATFLRALLKQRSGLMEPGNILSHAALFSPPPNNPHGQESFLITDSAVNVSPDLNTKKRILANVVQASHAMGVKSPAIALLAPVEVSTNRIQSTTDALELKKWLQGGALGECTADGPLALDVAASSDAAQAKGIDSPVAGRTDIYLAPNLDSGNILYKSLSVFAGFRVAGVLLGASVPVVLTSRSDNSETRLASLGLALRIANSPVQGNPLPPEEA